MYINWSVSDIIQEINKIKRAENDPMATGFETWGCKQDLYQILWHLEDCLSRCSTYSGEDDFLKKHDKEKTWRCLNGQ